METSHLNKRVKCNYFRWRDDSLSAKNCRAAKVFQIKKFCVWGNHSNRENLRWRMATGFSWEVSINALNKKKQKNVSFRMSSVEVKNNGTKVYMVLNRKRHKLSYPNWPKISIFRSKFQMLISEAGYISPFGWRKRVANFGTTKNRNSGNSIHCRYHWTRDSRSFFQRVLKKCFWARKQDPSFFRWYSFFHWKPTNFCMKRK